MSKKYQIIYADPPWRYNFSKDNADKIENHYPTMSLEAIKSLKIPSTDNAVLYLWATAPKLIDHRFLTQELADALKKARFKNIRLAWDYQYTHQFKIRKALKHLLKAGYPTRDITIFMICNWRIPYEECLQKLYLCAIWSVKVADCYFDGQVSPNIEPIGWSADQIKDFRKRVRKHNQLINFGVDPELRRKFDAKSKVGNKSKDNREGD